MIYYGTVIQGSAAALLGRLTDIEDDYITQATVESITYRVTRLDTETQISTGTLDKTVSVKDSLQTNNGWTEDDIGWDFVWYAAGTNWPVGGNGIKYQAEVVVTPTSGAANKFKAIWILDCIKTFTT